MKGVLAVEEGAGFKEKPTVHKEELQPGAQGLGFDNALVKADDVPVDHVTELRWLGEEADGSTSGSWLRYNGFTSGLLCS